MLLCICPWTIACCCININRTPPSSGALFPKHYLNYHWTGVLIYDRYTRSLRVFWVVAWVLFSALVTVINCREVTSDHVTRIGPLCASAAVPEDCVALLWPCVGLNMLIHASQPQEEDWWVASLPDVLVTKQGFYRSPARSLRSGATENSFHRPGRKSDAF